MKNIIISLLLLSCISQTLTAQSFSDEQTFTFDVNNLDALRLHNKYGEVKVTGTSGRKATLTVKRRIESASRTQLNKAKEEIYLDSIFSEGTLIFFVRHPDYRLEINENGEAHYNSKQENWNQHKVHYQQKFEMEIELQVPNFVPLFVSTHKEDLSVTNINADVLAQNHHGEINLQAIGGNVSAYTHHGKIRASMTQTPTRDTNFSTHHGDIEVTYPRDLSGDFSLKTKHGNFYTDFDYEASSLPTSLSKSKKGTKYKVEGGTNLRIGNGGPKLDLKTYHGSIYILK